jgi:DnaJ-class molecular chaperone
MAGRDVYAMLGMAKGASEAELMRGMRLALRLLHPDLAINLPLQGTRAGERIEAAFKRVNNLKDMRIEQWFSSEAHVARE